MTKFHKKMIGVLRAELGEVDDALDDVLGGWVTGVIISAAFEGLDHQRRQRRLRKSLRKGLEPEEMWRVGAIAVLTPTEANVKAM